MRYPGAEMKLDGHSGAPKSLGIGEVLVSKDVELADLDVGGGHAGRIDGSSWRGIGRDEGLRIR